MLHQRRCRDLDDDVVDADLQIRIERVDAFAHFRGAIHFDLGGEKEVRHRAERRDESFGDRLSNLRCRFVAISRPNGACCWFDGRAELSAAFG